MVPTGQSQVMDDEGIPQITCSSIIEMSQSGFKYFISMNIQHSKKGFGIVQKAFYAAKLLDFETVPL